MTQHAESMAQLEQIAALKAARNRVLEIYQLMVPLIAEMATNGDATAAYLLEEHDTAQDALKLTNMSAHTFLEDSTNG